MEGRDPMFLLQMAGFPGSGKSTLAKEISKHIDVVVIDRDVIKSSMTEAGVGADIVANASYSVTFSLCRFYLSIGKSVIIDTPCYYDESLENGMSIAREYNAKYKYIECRLEDFEEINSRLKSRTRVISQIEAAEKERFLRALDKSKKPANGDFLVVDSSLPIDTYIDKVLCYIQMN
jgi:predicted kinase